MFEAQKPLSLAFEAWLYSKLVAIVVGKLFTEKNSCSIAWFPGGSTVFLFFWPSVSKILFRLQIRQS